MLKHSRFSIILALQTLWILTLCTLGAWWGRLILRQAQTIVKLEGIAGVAASTAQAHWQKTQHMLFWESAVFFSLFLAISIVLFWTYWRDLKRTQSLHAFFASVTHELRTPLTSIRLQAEALLEEGLSNRDELIGRLLEDANRLESQVERVLELSRLEGGGKLFVQNLSLIPSISRVSSLWVQNHLHEIRLHNSVEDFPVKSDGFSVQIILKNLLENSIRHGARTPVTVELKSKTYKKWFILRYEDNGKGFTSDVRKLGSLFFKGPESQGTGVGLYLVNSLMKQMEGRAYFLPSKEGFRADLWFRKAAEGKTHG